MLSGKIAFLNHLDLDGTLHAVLVAEANHATFGFFAFQPVKRIVFEFANLVEEPIRPCLESR